MLLTVPLPRSINPATVVQHIQEILNKLHNPAFEVRFDMSRVGWVEPSGVTALANILSLLRHHRVNFYFIGDPSAVVVRYLDDCGFFEKFASQGVHSNSLVRNTTLPCQSLFCQDTRSWLDFQLTPWMRANFAASGNPLHLLRSALAEIFNNIQDHSTHNIGCIHVQHFPKRDCIGISISDFGIGIPASMREVEEFESDSDAVISALAQGASSKLPKHVGSMSRNRGEGLYTVVDNLVRGLRGAVEIRSYRGSVTITPQARNKFDAQFIYPGTLVDVTLPTTGWVDNAEGSEEFIWS